MIFLSSLLNVFFNLSDKSSAKGIKLFFFACFLFCFINFCFLDLHQSNQKRLWLLNLIFRSIQMKGKKDQKRFTKKDYEFLKTKHEKMFEIFDNKQISNAGWNLSRHT